MTISDGTQTIISQLQNVSVIFGKVILRLTKIDITRPFFIQYLIDIHDSIYYVFTEKGSSYQKAAIGCLLGKAYLYGAGYRSRLMNSSFL